MSRDIFVTRSSQELPGLTLAFILGMKDKMLKKGEVGIEIEVEGKNLLGVSQPPPPEPWLYKADHSLRGQENGEYVLSSPILFTDVSKSLSKLWDDFGKYKTTFDDSNRTSVHIHLNCQRWHINRVAAFAALHFILEEVLTEWCGEHRVGNLFCLRAKDAEAIVTWLKKFVQSDAIAELPDGLHYSGFNIHALLKFGSIEIRTLRGVSDPNVIQSWIAIYEQLYNLSGTIKDPTEICDWFSAEGPTAFFSRVLGPVAATVRNGVSMSTDEIADSLYAGVRRAQDICFCRDWSFFKTLDIEDNPFGFSKKRLVEKALQANGVYDAESTSEVLDYPDPEPDYDDISSMPVYDEASVIPPSVVATGMGSPQMSGHTLSHWSSFLSGSNSAS